jgi:hypothetical protein
MKNIFKFALTFLILLLALPLGALADDNGSGGGPEYLQWLREQQAKGNQPAAQQPPAQPGMNSQPGAMTPSAGGPLQIDYTGQMDVTGLMQRLTAVLTSPEWFGSDPNLQPLIKALQDSGKLNLAGCKETLHIDQSAVHYTLATHYAGLAPDSLKGQLYALPNKPLSSAQYVGTDALAYVGINNVPQTALIAFRWLVAHPETLQKGPLADLVNKALSQQLGGQSITPDQLQQAAGLLDSSGLENQMNSMITGEIGAALFDADVQKLGGDDFKPEDLDLAVFVGVKDSAGVEKLLTSAGADAGIQAAGEQGGWKLFTIKDQPGLGLALNGNVLLGATRFDAFTKRLQGGAAKLSTPDCQYFIRLNLQRLLREYAEPLATQAIAEDGSVQDLKSQMDQQGLPSLEKLDAAWAYVLGADKLGDLGALTLSGRYENGYQCDATMNPDVFLYGLYQFGRVGGMGALEDHLKQQDAQSDEDGSGDSGDAMTPGAGQDGGAMPPAEPQGK